MPVLSLFFAPVGRVGRGPFWLGMLALWVVAIGLMFLPGRGRVAWIGEALLIWPWLCLIIKRLHDRGRTGWWAALPAALNGVLLVVLLISIVMAFSFGSSAPDPETGRVSSTGAMNLTGGIMGLATLLVLAVFNLWFVAWVGLARSDPGANRYGPGRDAQATTFE